MWVLTKRDDVLRVLQDWQTFSSAYDKHVEADVDTGMGEMPPMFTDPPLQRDFRHLLNPFLSPAAIAAHEPKVRRIVTDLIDDFIDDGQCDLISQFAKPILLRSLSHHLRHRERRRSPDHAQPSAQTDGRVRAAAQAAGMAGWMDWISGLVETRQEARRPDLIDSLLYGTVEGRPLTDDEISGVLRILVLGGFFTTNDAIGSADAGFDRAPGDPGATQAPAQPDPDHAGGGPAHGSSRDVIVSGVHPRRGGPRPPVQGR